MRPRHDAIPQQDLTAAARRSPRCLVDLVVAR
jgi:hypothetical protein